MEEKLEIREKNTTDFFNTSYLNYAMYVIENRAIPSVIDGLKTSHRKIIHVANQTWKSGKEKPMKVEVFAAFVHAKTKFHHAAGSLQNATVSIAQKFKNNLPLLEAIGQFGTLRNPEAAATRYISVQLHGNFKNIYKDFELLTPQYDEDDEIEPKFFLPIIPTILVNGSSGIAVGFASDILNRNPLLIVEACLSVLSGKTCPILKPHLNGYTGEYRVSNEKPNSWIIAGKYEVVNTSTIRITELPPSHTYESYEIHLNKLIEKKNITSYEDNCSKDINYLIKFRREDLAKYIENDTLIKLLKLEEKYTENLTTLDETGKLRIFSTAEEIVYYFVNFRLQYYQKRKDFLILQLENKINYLSNRSKYIQLVIEGKIKVFKQDTAVVIENIQKHKIDMHEGSYNYLLSIANGSFTADKVIALDNEILNLRNNLNTIINTAPKDTYKQELLELKKILN